MNRITTSLLSLALAASLLPACASNVNDTDVEKETITATQLRDYMKNERKSVLLIDSRINTEYSAGHIPGAVNMSVTQVAAPGPNGESTTDARLLKYSTLIVYGSNRGSISSMALGKRLIEAGYKDVKYFSDGFEGWKSAGLPIETGAAAKPGVR